MARCILQDVVYATLILALEEGARSAYEALRSAAGTAGVDLAALNAIESLAGLALRLQIPGQVPRTHPEPRSSTDVGEELIASALSALADSIALPVWISDPGFVLEWTNPAFAELLGADLKRVRGMPWYRWCDPVDTKRVAQVLEAAGLEQRNWSIEAGAGPEGGPYTRLLMVAAPRLSLAGRLLGWTGICFDVTRNATLPSRLESVTRPLMADAAKTQALLRQFPGMMWTTDLELCCTFAHGAAFLDRGAEPTQLVGRSLGEIVGSSDPSHPALQAHRAALAGNSVSYPDAYAGRVFDAHVEPLRDPRGNVAGCIGLAVDVTERIAREREQQQLARQLGFGQRVGRLGTWEVDVRTGEWLWSDEAFRLLGAEPGVIEPCFETFLERVHPDDRDRLQRRHVEGVRTGQGYDCQYRLVRFDGRVRQMRGVVEFEHGADGALLRIAGILQDLTPIDGSGGFAI
jgi:PAS domain-containing protein